jgi:hypothetical protein
LIDLGKMYIAELNERLDAQARSASVNQGPGARDQGPES